MAAVDKVRELVETRFTDEDGDEYQLEASPPMCEQEIATVGASIPCPLPADLRELLQFARGFENGPLESFEFAGLPGPTFEFPEIFPHCVPIAHDGFGNYWVVDLTPQSTEWGPIFFACHDAPVIVYQSATLEDFLDAFAELAHPPFKGPIDWVHEEATQNIWKNNPGVLSHGDATASSDSALREFAASLDDSWSLIDLRNAKMGDGFSWGRHGPRTNVRRHGHDRIFAYQFRSWWQRLLGR